MSDTLRGLYFFSRFAWSFSRLGYRQRRLLWSEPEGDLSGQRWLVSGASGGIGRAIALGAVERGAEVVAVARSTERLAALAAEAGPDLKTRVADLSLLSQTRELAAALAGEPAFDVLINNVGVLLNDWQLTAEGHECSFATNLLGHYLLTRELSDADALAGDACVINMSSGGMYNVPLELERLNALDADTYDGVQAYAFHKRAQVVLNEWWRSRHADTEREYYVMHPGWVDTDGVRTSLPGFRALFKHVLRDEAQGADTALWLAAERPPQRDAGAIWFDRAARSAHLGLRTRVRSASGDELVAFLDDLAG